MRLPLRSAMLAAVVVVVAACDAPVAVRAVDAGVAEDDVGDAAIVDAGAADAGAASAIVVDAGVSDADVVDAGVDAGVADIAAAAASASKRPTLSERPKTLSIYDRILVRPTDAKATPASVKAAIEKHTKMSVSTVRVTAKRFYLVEMAPTQPKRSKDGQARLVEQVRKSPAFSSVEADRLMQLR